MGSEGGFQTRTENFARAQNMCRKICTRVVRFRFAFVPGFAPRLRLATHTFTIALSRGASFSAGTAVHGTDPIRKPSSSAVKVDCWKTQNRSKVSALRCTGVPPCSSIRPQFSLNY